MRGYYTADEVRTAEAGLFAEVADGVPMGRAAYGLATVVAAELRAATGGVAGRTVTLLVGSGDNGGDALWAGSLLRRRGVAVRAVLLDPERAHVKGLAAFRKSGGRIDTDIGTPDVVIDGIVGISGSGPLRPPAARLVETIAAPIISADLPSGVDANTGAVDGPAVTATVTVAFGALKPVHALAAARCGRIVLVPIGLRLPDAELLALEPAEVGALWPVPGPFDDKYSQGVVGIRAGSAVYPGAAVLCTGAAVAATSGMVRYVGSATDQVLTHCPEVVAAQTVQDAGRVQSWVVGPGGGTDEAALQALQDILATDLPVVVDADALTLVAADPNLVRNRRAPTVLTPHAGEFARLTGSPIGPDRLGAVRDLAVQWGVTVLLKGRATLVAGSGRTLVNDAGGSWAATAGAGDVLSGIIGALLASGLDADRSAAAAARVHALAANLAATRSGNVGAPISASPLLAQVGAAIRVLRGQSLSP